MIPLTIANKCRQFDRWPITFCQYSESWMSGVDHVKQCYWHMWKNSLQPDIIEPKLSLGLPPWRSSNLLTVSRNHFWKHVRNTLYCILRRTSRGIPIQSTIWINYIGRLPLPTCFYSSYRQQYHLVQEEEFFHRFLLALTRTLKYHEANDSATHSI